MGNSLILALGSLFIGLCGGMTLNFVAYEPFVSLGARVALCVLGVVMMAMSGCLAAAAYGEVKK